MFITVCSSWRSSCSPLLWSSTEACPTTLAKICYLESPLLAVLCCLQDALSIAWISKVVLGGRNRQVMKPLQPFSSSGWAEQLSISNKALGKWIICTCWWRLTAGKKSFLNHSVKISESIWAFHWDLQMAGIMFMFTFLKHSGFANFALTTGWSLCVPVHLCSRG